MLGMNRRAGEMIWIVVVCGVVGLASGFPQGQGQERPVGEECEECGYERCTESVAGMLNVHLVPHTHDDVGWLKTVDQYYFGSRTNIQNAGVQYILDSVVNELLHDPKKKFIYVETAFFWKWWKEQEDHMKHRVKQLVKKGQLEFIGGAWSMNDEATTHYQSIIDQFTWGFRKLNDTFGYCGQPKIGWQIDPFGHSREMASIMAQLGFDGLFFGRLDYQDKRNRANTTKMEMIWEANPSLGPSSDILAGALHNLYQAPKNFCFDIMCGDEPIIDDIHSPDYNVDKKVNEFLGAIYRQWGDYKKQEIMITMGGDFNYLDAHYYFKNLDKLIRYVNARKSKTGVNVFYSTPSCYVKSLHDLDRTWPTKQDDFFPYASDPHAYWTGYFTSRPTLKYFERLGNNHLQMCKQLSSLAHLGPEDNPDIDALREAMGIMQHHDAITGTEKRHVAHDYARILTDALRKCQIVSNAGLNKLMTKESPAVPPLSFSSCLLTNISECSVSSESRKFLATVYNPLSRAVDLMVRLPVDGRSYSVRSPEGGKIGSQVVALPQALLRVPGRTSRSSLELVFRAEAVPPLGYRVYYVSEQSSKRAEGMKEGVEEEEEVVVGGGGEYLFGGKGVEGTLDGATGLLSSVSFQGRKIKFSQNLEYYIGYAGFNDKFTDRASGAYIFRPKQNESIEITGKVNSTVFKGPIVTEVHQDFSPWASQVIRQYSGDPTLEIEWLVGPIPVEDDNGKEIISRFVTDLNSGGKFFTDSNGRQTIERKRNFRPTWNLELKEPISGNYYPVTTDISINDGDIEVTVLTDRAQGGSSLRDGEMELMLHRRLLFDDGFGVGEALNEEAFGKGLVARGRHWISVGQVGDPNRPKQKSLLRQEKVLSPQVVLTNATDLSFEDLAKTYRLEYSGVRSGLPPEVQILTLEPWKGKSYLLRLEHLLEKNEGEAVAVNLSDLFSAFDIVSARETSLGANRWADEVSRFTWKKESNEIFHGTESPIDRSFPQIVIRPKEIRTFVCEIKPRKVV